jgi:nitrate/TMAO reductase-like tetraheme cytochrome c subunit
MAPRTSPARQRRHQLAWRVVALVAFVAAASVGYVVYAQRSLPTTAEMRGHLVEGECADCHKDIWGEWAESGHAKAWTSELYQRTRVRYDFPTDCDPCHAPQPLHITGMGEAPKLRDEDRNRGVDCLACHLGPDGKMHGPGSDPSPFHAVQRDLALYTRRVTVCESCHGQKSVAAHDVVTEYRESQSARQAEPCQRCHMPETNRKPAKYSRRKKRGGSHAFLGSRSQEWLEGALRLDYERTDSGVTVYVMNSAAHSVPAAPLRAMQLGILITAADGDVLHSDVKLYTHPLDVAGVAVEVGAPDDRLKAEEVRSIEIALDGSALDGAKLTINVLYRRHDDDPWTQIASLSEGL